MSLNMNRRDLLRAMPGGVAILATLDRWILDLGAQEDSQENMIDIRIVNTYRIGRWYFDPVGVYLKPGQKVRWICTKWGGSVTAFHPSNLNHELRIPQSAEPFDSGRLIQGDTPRARFEWVFEQEGTYDYFSRHHENLGAVGSYCGRFSRWPGGEACWLWSKRRESTSLRGCKKASFLARFGQDPSGTNRSLSDEFAGTDLSFAGV